MDLSANKKLVELNLMSCSIENKLDISNKSNLKTVKAGGSKITEINTEGCTVLKTLEIANNSIESLDLSTNKDLVKLICNNNKISSLDLSNNTKLDNLNCAYNRIWDLDLSKNTQLKSKSLNQSFKLKGISDVGNIKFDFSPYINDEQLKRVRFKEVNDDSIDGSILTLGGDQYSYSNFGYYMDVKLPNGNVDDKQAMFIRIYVDAAVLPAEDQKVKVENPEELTSEEKGRVAELIRGLNPRRLSAEWAVKIENNGTAVLNFAEAEDDKSRTVSVEGEKLIAKKTMADKFTEEYKGSGSVTVYKGKEIDKSKIAFSPELKEGITIGDITGINTSEAGEKKGKVKLIFGDKTEMEVDLTATVKELKPSSGGNPTQGGGTAPSNKDVSDDKKAVRKLSGGSSNPVVNPSEKQDDQNEIDRAYIKGYKDGTIKPDQDVTRAEAAKMFNIFFDRGVNEDGLKDLENPQDMAKFSDLTEEHWGYYELVEASNTHEYKKDESKGRFEKWIKILKDLRK